MLELKEMPPEIYSSAFRLMFAFCQANADPIPNSASSLGSSAPTHANVVQLILPPPTSILQIFDSITQSAIEYFWKLDPTGVSTENIIWHTATNESSTNTIANTLNRAPSSTSAISAPAAFHRAQSVFSSIVDGNVSAQSSARPPSTQSNSSATSPAAPKAAPSIFAPGMLSQLPALWLLLNVNRERAVRLTSFALLQVFNHFH
jgi:hypothetical protein